MGGGRRVSYITVPAGDDGMSPFPPRHRYRDSPAEEKHFFTDEDDYMPKRKTYSQKLRQQWHTRQRSLQSMRDAIPRRRGRLVCLVVAALAGCLVFALVISTRSSLRLQKFLEQQTAWSTSEAPFVGRKHHKGADQPSRPKKATNFALDFASLYPSLSSSPDPRCQAAWSKLNAVPCHEKIWDRSWDNGTMTSATLRDLQRHIPHICAKQCSQALEEALESVENACSREDVFLTSGYRGRFSLEQLESGPVEALSTLVQRHRHTCRASEEPGLAYCLLELSSRWGIVDGINSEPLAGLGEFLEATETSRVEKPHHVKGSRPSSSKVPERQLGPGRGETACGQCTVDFFIRKLQSWKGGETRDRAGEPLSLPDFIRTVRKAGRRCEREAWDEAYDSTIAKYETAGLLPPGWDGAPSGDLAYLLQHGASEGDAPLPQLRHALTQASTRGAACLEALHDHIAELPCYYTVGRATAAAEIILYPERLDDYCSPTCTNLRDGSNNDHWRDRCAAVLDPLAGETVRAYEDALVVHSQVCRRPASEPGYICAPSLQVTGGPDWVFDGRPATPAFVDAMDLALTVFENYVVGIITDPDPSEDWNLRYHPSPELLMRGMCSICIWDWMVGSQDKEGVAEVEKWVEQAEEPTEYLALVKRYAETCRDYSADFINAKDIDRVRDAVAAGSKD